MPRRPVVKGLATDEQRVLRQVRRDAILALARRWPSFRFGKELAHDLGLTRRRMRAEVDRPIAADLPRPDFERLRALGGFDLPPAASPAPSHPSPDPWALAVQAIEGWTKLRFLYTDSDGARTARTVWPLRLTHHDLCLAAWCESRQAFRTFRLDRMGSIAMRPEEPPRSREVLLAEWRAALPAEDRVEASEED